MAQIEAELGRLIRRFIAGQDRTPGTAAPETRDAQANPYHDTDSGRVVGLASGRQSNHPDRDATGSARRGAANDFANRRQDRLEIKSYRESLQDETVLTGGVTILDPNAFTCFRIRAEGSVIVQLVDPIPVDLGDDAETPLSVTSIVLRLSRPAGASITWPVGTLFPKTLQDLDASESPLGVTSVASLDEFVLEHWPATAGPAMFRAGGTPDAGAPPGHNLVAPEEERIRVGAVDLRVVRRRPGRGRLGPALHLRVQFVRRRRRLRFSRDQQSARPF